MNTRACARARARKRERAPEPWNNLPEPINGTRNERREVFTNLWLHPRQKQRSTWSFAAGTGRGLPPFDSPRHPTLSPPVPRFPLWSAFRERNESGFGQYVALSTRAAARTLTDTLPHAHACQSITRIGLLKFLRARRDGERMEILSFAPLTDRTPSRTRFIRGEGRTSHGRTPSRYSSEDGGYHRVATVGEQGGGTSSPFNLVTHVHFVIIVRRRHGPRWKTIFV